ncbi:NnrS family protein [Paracoccus stylophorae]|uniref:NnrS family protein n=1 Tax=Paracoccus stylophorae TaxID=659350 RepID=A0ABY7STX2_9RHOB|nr:NnrS family protein [Paracoccus stylophorae]WCR10502.1 NnrS family protein [Paracoccus stylophorae]
MAGTAERMRSYRGPALLSFGFRPFFLLAAIWAALAMILWIAMLAGAAPLPMRFDPITWHAHEFLFGYLAAVIGGFVLTAVPNWTGRLPVMGWGLGALAGLWVLGRIAVSVSALLPWQAVMLADLAMIVALLACLLPEVVRGRNWRNLPVLGLVAVYGLGNAMFHIQAERAGIAFEGAGMRLGLAGALMLIALIGGRIVPSFTRNWLAARDRTTLPVAFGRADAAVLIGTGLVLLLFVLSPDLAVLPVLMLATGAAHLWRMSRWCGHRVLAEPLLWVLHLGYAMLALGFLAEAAAGLGALSPAAARHVWLAGAIGTMTMAVMSRATLGHTGRALHAGAGTTAIYLALTGSVAARLLAGLAAAPGWMMHLSAGLWIAAFAGFVAIYGPMLVRPKTAPRAASPLRTSRVR